MIYRMDRAIDSLERLVAQQPSDASPSAVLALPLAQSLLAMKPMDPFAQLSQELIFKDDNLNDSQKEAVRFALESPEIALVCPQSFSNHEVFSLLRILSRYTGLQEYVEP